MSKRSRRELQIARRRTIKPTITTVCNGGGKRLYIEDPIIIEREVITDHGDFVFYDIDGVNAVDGEALKAPVQIPGRAADSFQEWIDKHGVICLTQYTEVAWAKDGKAGINYRARGFSRLTTDEFWGEVEDKNLNVEESKIFSSLPTQLDEDDEADV